MKAVGVTARSFGRLSDRKLSRIMLVFGGSLLLCLLAGLFAYLLIQDLFASGSFPAGVKIVGVSVAGLNRTEAIQECTSELSEVANRPLTLQVDADKYQISARDIGLLLDYRGMVERAYKRAWSVNLFERMGRRFTNRPREVNVSLLAQGDRGRVNGWVSSVINQINRQPRDAYVDVTSGAAVIVKATDGRNANLGELLADSDAALRRPDRTVKVRVGRVPAATTDEAFGRLIIINIAEHKLSLFERERLLAEYPVACGSPTYPSPVGKWKIVEKQMNPTWHNPGSGWASGMPPSIPPGPGNPLGTRALALNAPGVLIHGTPSSWSIGQNVSHGCVRMYMANVEQLFDMVEVNTPVYVTGSAGNPGFDVTAKPFWQK